MSEFDIFPVDEATAATAAVYLANFIDFECNDLNEHCANVERAVKKATVSVVLLACNWQD